MADDNREAPPPPAPPPAPPSEAAAAHEPPLTAIDSDGADDTGGGAAIDEELANLSVPKRRSPIVGLLVIAVAGLLITRLLPDVRYAMSSSTPIDLGDARDLQKDASRLADNSFVSLHGQPDYRNALLFEPKGDNYRRAFFRMLGTGDQLWVRAEQTNTRHDLGGTITGRLRRFDAIPFGDQVRDYYEKKVKVTRLLDLDELKRVLQSSNLDVAKQQLHDRAGQPVDAEQAGDVQVVVDFHDQLLVSLPRDKFAVEEDARRELERLGQPVGPVKETRTDFVFPVWDGFSPGAGPSPGSGSGLGGADQGRRNAFIAKLEEKGYGFALRRERFVTSLSALRQVSAGAPGGDGALSIPSSPAHPAIYEVKDQRLLPRAAAERTELAWRQIHSVQVTSPIRIPHDAWVVMETEVPGDFAFVPWLAGLLVLFGLVNVWLVLRALSSVLRPGARGR